MAKSYDNLEDVKSKLLGTIVLYGGVPCLVKTVYTAAEWGHDDYEYWLNVTNNLTGRQNHMRGLTDPLFNFTKFNIGYANYPASAVWWYRLPAKQYRQGLKADQFRYHASDRAPGGMYSLGPSKSIEQMLTGEYPHLDEIEKAVKEQEGGVFVRAFHKDFAVSYDRIHKDMILEYKGQLIGNMISRKDFRLLDEYKHLNEAVSEAMTNVA